MVTFEFENVPAETAAAAAEYTPVRPGGSVLHITQNRIREKNFLRRMRLARDAVYAGRQLSRLRRAVATARLSRRF